MANAAVPNASLAASPPEWEELNKLSKTARQWLTLCLLVAVPGAIFIFDRPSDPRASANSFWGAILVLFVATIAWAQTETRWPARVDGDVVWPKRRSYLQLLRSDPPDSFDIRALSVSHEDWSHDPWPWTGPDVHLRFRSSDDRQLSLRTCDGQDLPLLIGLLARMRANGSLSSPRLLEALDKLEKAKQPPAAPPA